jgi:hypothetical protein
LSKDAVQSFYYTNNKKEEVTPSRLLARASWLAFGANQNFAFFTHAHGKNMKK